MSEYTPSMGGMREAYHRWGIVNENVVAPSELDAEFDRFIEQVRAEAWDEGYETGCSSPYGTATPSGKPYDPEPNPYRIEGKHE